MTVTETGQADVFGESKVVPRSGAICISQRQIGDKFQLINPHKDLVILRGWSHTMIPQKLQQGLVSSGSRCLPLRSREQHMI